MCLQNDSYVDVELFDGGTAEDPIVVSSDFNVFVSPD